MVILEGELRELVRLGLFVTIDEVGLGSSSFPSACAVFFVCVDLAWDAVNCFLCGIRFAEH